uniref:Uncharacterized protein n=1 Tax=Oryza meridionalis TaxID=40149 RepID=A0A0E0EGP0_9ORYZ
MAGKALISFSNSNSTLHLEGEIELVNQAFPMLEDGEPRILESIPGNLASCQARRGPPAFRIHGAQTPTRYGMVLILTIILTKKMKMVVYQDSPPIIRHISPPPIKRLTGEFESDGDKYPHEPTVACLASSIAQLPAENQRLKDNVVEECRACGAQG